MKQKYDGLRLNHPNSRIIILHCQSPKCCNFISSLDNKIKKYCNGHDLKGIRKLSITKESTQQKRFTNRMLKKIVQRLDVYMERYYI